MSHVPVSSLSSTQFYLDTGFTPTPGTQDLTYNPKLVDGLFLHQLFGNIKYLHGPHLPTSITVSSDGIVLPAGYHYVLEPYMAYSSGSTWLNSPHFLWQIDGVDQSFPKFASHYATDSSAVLATNGETANGRSYRGLLYVDCSLASKSIKLKAVGNWAGMGDVYLDNQQTSTALAAPSRSSILITAINSANVVNPTVRTLDITTGITQINGGADGSYNTDCYFPGSNLTLPVECLNRYFITTGSTSVTYTLPDISLRTVGDWFGWIYNKVGGSGVTNDISSTSPTQTLISGINSTQPNHAIMFQWTGAKWVNIPFSSRGLVKIPNA
jgi:hypothetical protein